MTCTWKAAFATAAITAQLISVPASTITIGGLLIAEPRQPCKSGASKPLSGLYNQLYSCMNDQWVASDGIGSAGPQGPGGANGTNGMNGTDGAAGAPAAPPGR